DGHKSVDVPGRQRDVQRLRAFRDELVGDALWVLEDDRLAGSHRPADRIGTLRLDTDDLDRRPRATNRERHSRDQAAATHRDHDELDVMKVIEALQADRALA